jgi:hypothetical protein
LDRDHCERGREWSKYFTPRWVLGFAETRLNQGRWPSDLRHRSACLQGVTSWNPWFCAGFVNGGEGRSWHGRCYRWGTGCCTPAWIFARITARSRRFTLLLWIKLPGNAVRRMDSSCGDLPQCQLSIEQITRCQVAEAWDQARENLGEANRLVSLKRLRSVVPCHQHSSLCNRSGNPITNRM